MLFSILASVTACTGQNTYHSADANHPDSAQAENRFMPSAPYDPPAGGDAYAESSGNTVIHTLMDSKTHQPWAYLPLPASWKINTAGSTSQPAITGPNGLEIYAGQYQHFMYSNDPMTTQVYQSSGIAMRPPVGIQNLIFNDLNASLRKQGLEYVGQFPLPLVARADRSYMDQLYVSGQRNYRFEAAGTEWKTRTGKKVCIVVHYNEMPSAGMMLWGYSVQSLTAEPGYYEEARNAYIHGLASIKYDEQRIAEYNYNEKAKENRNRADHNARMQSNQQAFETRQRIHNETYETINKASMNGYYSRNESMNRNQHAYTNYIYGENTVTDPASGESYQVEGYYNQYWMNGNGEYIPSNNNLYNPNLDPAMNHQNWQQAPENPYGK